jgi:hypothetical protein
MPRGLNGTHRELSLTGIVVPDIRRPPALQAREDPNSDGGRGPVRFAASFAVLTPISEDKRRIRRKAQSLRMRAKFWPSASLFPSRR